ncbi:MAG TPA: hypothetical protein VHA35_01255 [Dongiaceae bacterium]|nr:hypothetical protein [Dongiaceae bacterium]
MMDQATSTVPAHAAQTTSSDLTERIPAAVRAALESWLGEPRARLVLRSLRDPAEVMTPDALSAVKPSSLSIIHPLLQRMTSNHWAVSRRAIEADEIGNGHAVYDLQAEGYAFSLIVHASWDGEEKPGRRMDKTADFLLSIVNGLADDALIARELAGLSVPYYGGRTDSKSFGWSAANRSQRSFQAVVDTLAAGRMPDIDDLQQNGGYVLRNAGFYGNGRAGAANWLSIPAASHPFSDPYHMDLFLLYMWREIGLDFVEAIATKRAGTVRRLDPRLRRYLGVGNSSGLGMTCALVRWPQWVGTWCLMREIALAYALSEPVHEEHVDKLAERLAQAARFYAEIPGPAHGLTPHPILTADLAKVAEQLDAWRAGDRGRRNWRQFYEAVRAEVGRDAVEQLVAFLIDLHPELVARLLTLMPTQMRRTRAVVPEMTIGALRRLIARDYRWALDIDMSSQESTWHFWYHSEESGEQRRGERYVDPHSEYETFVDVVRPVQACFSRMEGLTDSENVGHFLLANPDLAYIVSRIQFLEFEPYGEIRGNLIARSFLPLKVIRFLLSVFGLESGIPKSAAWVQGVLLQGAPTPEEIRQGRLRDWRMPLRSSWNTAS